MAPFRTFLMLVPLLACSSPKEPPKEPAPPAVETRAPPPSFAVAAAVRKACPTASDAAALEHALLELGPALTRVVPAEEHTPVDPNRRSFEFHVEMVGNPVILDGFPVELDISSPGESACLRVEQPVQPSGNYASTDEGKVQNCGATAPSASTDFYLFVQLHLDCTGGKRALVFQSPTPREGVLTLDNPTLVSGPFDVWLGLVAEGKRLKLAGGCFPFWSERLRQRAGLQVGTERIETDCMPFMVKTSDGSYIPWFFIKPRRGAPGMDGGAR